jgi:ribosomal protein RSM22 (predicted rRNA methylase)
MLGLALVRPLEDDWRVTLDAVASGRRWPTSHHVAELGARVARLSEAYNCATIAHAAVREAGAARLGFVFARDVPKAAAAVRELVATGLLRLHDGPLRVLDVGAGLGATTWGVVRALEAAGGRGEVHATWLDADGQALDLGLAVLRERAGRAGNVVLRASAISRSLPPVHALDRALVDLGRFDLVLVGQVLSELDIAAPREDRVHRHAALLHALLDRCTNDHGALVVVEPALRDRTRHLHAVRDELAARGATIFAPCLHCGPCPALARQSDWCHEDIEVDLPRWLAPVARVAGLRREGLTFSYLVTRKDGARLADALGSAHGFARLRIVSQPIRSKGKRELFVCGELAEGSVVVATRLKTMRLDRDASRLNASWEELMRGDVVAVEPAPTRERPRLDRATTIVRLDDESR